MPRNIIFLVNPIAGATKKGAILREIEKVTSKKGIGYRFVTANPAGNYGLLKDAVEQENITDIIIVGGDGTINHVVSALMGVKVRFGIIPMGSGNGLAYAAGISRRPAKALEQMLNGAARPVDAFLINNQYSCMLSGLGLDACVVHDFETRHTRGLLTYVLLTFKQYFKAKPWRFEITIENLSFFTEAFFISIANGNQFGNNVTIAPYASLSDGLMDVVIVRKMNKIKLLFAVFRQLTGGNKPLRLTDDFTKKQVLNFQTCAFAIKNPGLAPLHVDGDAAKTAAEFNIRVLKHCFELIQPGEEKYIVHSK